MLETPARRRKVNMECSRLKIMQVCGYLNSRYVRVPALLKNQLPAKI